MSHVKGRPRARRLCHGLEWYTMRCTVWCLGVEVYTDLSFREVGVMLGHDALYLRLSGGHR